MRPFEIFRNMAPDQALHFCRGLSDGAPASYAQALALAGAAMRARPVFLKKQPFERRAEAIRRALARVASNELAEEFLAVYFLECRKSLLVEWLDGLGIAHEDGVLTDDDVSAPDDDALRKTVDAFRSGGAGDDAPDPAEAGDRALLLHAFAAQSSVSWPVLDEMLAG